MCSTSKLAFELTVIQSEFTRKLLSVTQDRLYQSTRASCLVVT